MALLAPVGKPVYHDGRDQKEQRDERQREVEGRSAIYEAVGYSKPCHAGADGEGHKGLRIQRLNAEDQGRYACATGFTRQLNAADKAEPASENQREGIGKELQWSDGDGNKSR